MIRIVLVNEHANILLTRRSRKPYRYRHVDIRITFIGTLRIFVTSAVRTTTRAYPAFAYESAPFLTCKNAENRSADTIKSKSHESSSLK